jgi:hypothetical protein
MVRSDTVSAAGDSPIATPQDTLGPSTLDTTAQADTGGWR